MTDAEKSTLEGLQFKLGHIAGNAQQVLDEAKALEGEEFPDMDGFLEMGKSIQDAALHVSKTLEKMRLADG